MKIRTNKATAKATRIFTDREEPRAAFWKQYNRVKTEICNKNYNVNVLNYYGIGGIGKSSLLKKIMSEIDEQILAPRYIYIDLNICQESRVILDRMKNKLANNYKFSFPLFELGCYAYAKKVGENVDPVEVKQLIEKSPILNMMISIAGEIPVVGIAAKVLSFADQGIAFIRTYLKNHNRELKQIEIMEPEDLYKFLPYLFAQDMTHNLEKEVEEPLVIFLDTYEKLVNELSSVGEPLKNDEWLRGENGLVQNIPNVLWVIAGRERLKWELFDPEWADALEHHILGSLSYADSDHFLFNAGVTDFKLREQLYKLTDGTPVYLDLCIDRFLRILDNGEIPNISMFGKNTFDLIERFVRYMGETQKDLVYMLACLNKWDDRLIADIAPSVISNFSFTAYEKTKDYSFVIASDDNFYNLHQTVGSILIENCPDSIKQRVGNRLIEKFSKVVEEKKVFSQFFSTALTYVTQAGLLLYNNRENLCKFYEEKISENLLSMVYAGKLEQSKVIFNLLYDGINNDIKDLLYANVILDQACFMEISGMFDMSKKMAQCAYNCFSNILDEKNAKSLKAIHIMANNCYRLGNYSEALTLFEYLYGKRCESLGQKHPETIHAMNNIATTLDRMGEYKKSLKLKQTVVDDFTDVYCGTHPKTLLAIGNLASTYDYLGEYKKSLELKLFSYENSLQIFGENHLYTISAMNNLANTMNILGEHKKAKELLSLVVEKRKNYLGENHPDTIRAIGNLANVFDSMNDFDKSLCLRKEVVKKRKQILGDNHPDTLLAIKKMAETLNAMKDHKKSICLLRYVIKNQCMLLGEKHPETLESKQLLLKIENAT